MDFSKLAKLAADIVGSQLSNQEGFPIKFKAVIIHTRSGDYLVRWEEGKDLSLEKLESVCKGMFGFGSSEEHPPTFDLRSSLESLSFPLRIPYSAMAGPLAGRGGYFIIHSDGRIEDHCIWVS